MGEYTQLILACASFVGSHFLMSHPLRAPMVKAMGNGPFLGLYSLVSLATLLWMIFAFRAAPNGAPYWAATDAVWGAATLLTLLAAVLYAGSMVGNPAMPTPNAEVEAKVAAVVAREPSGAFRVTRHPMMWSFALWGIAHILVAPRIDNFIFVGSIIFLALAGARAQEAKKQKTIPAVWESWQARTSFWPRLSQLPRMGVRLWLIGILIWAAASWLHSWFGAPAAGIYRWL